MDDNGRLLSCVSFRFLWANSFSRTGAFRGLPSISLLDDDVSRRIPFELRRKETNALNAASRRCESLNLKIRNSIRHYFGTCRRAGSTGSPRVCTDLSALG